MNEKPLYNPAIHHRRSIRLQEYDYSQAGAYFITICTHNRECLFGAVGAGSKPAHITPTHTTPAHITPTHITPTHTTPAHAPAHLTPAPGLAAKDRAGLEPAPTQSAGSMVLNEYGEIVKYTWEDLINHVYGIELDAFVVMPNHVHGIIVMVGTGSVKRRAGLEPAPTGICTLSEIVRQLKTFSARRINKKRGIQGRSVWQRNYWEHIIRDESELNRIREYICNNPAQWASDRLYEQTTGRQCEIRESAAKYGLEDWMV